jgi:hypothetical protein
VNEGEPALGVKLPDALAGVHEVHLPLGVYDNAGAGVGVRDNCTGEYGTHPDENPSDPAMPEGSVHEGSPFSAVVRQSQVMKFNRLVVFAFD